MTLQYEKEQFMNKHKGKLIQLGVTAYSIKVIMTVLRRQLVDRILLQTHWQGQSDHQF